MRSRTGGTRGQTGIRSRPETFAPWGRNLLQGTLLFFLDGRKLSRHIVLDPVGIPPLHGVDRYSLNKDAEVEVVSSGQSGLTCQTDHLSPSDRLARAHIRFAQVGITAGQTLSMIEDDRQTVNAKVV
jgi:hypothetical protein